MGPQQRIRNKVLMKSAKYQYNANNRYKIVSDVIHVLKYNKKEVAAVHRTAVTSFILYR